MEEEENPHTVLPTIKEADKKEYLKLLPILYPTLNRIQAPNVTPVPGFALPQVPTTPTTPTVPGSSAESISSGTSTRKKSIFSFSSNRSRSSSTNINANGGSKFSGGTDDNLITYNSSGAKIFYKSDKEILKELRKDRCMTRILQFASKYRVPEYQLYDIAQLTIFDIYLYIDNSKSMVFGFSYYELHQLVVMLLTLLGQSHPIKIRFKERHDKISQAVKTKLKLDLNKITKPEQLHVVFTDSEVRSIIAHKPTVKAEEDWLGSKLNELIIEPDILSKKKGSKIDKPKLVYLFTGGPEMESLDPFFQIMFANDLEELKSFDVETGAKLEKMGLSRKSVLYHTIQVPNFVAAGSEMERIAGIEAEEETLQEEFKYYKNTFLNVFDAI
ncbi:unnamed protein product [Ambrosiozyma monospora]|uniref:Unnamed protein product n=1 Tax=Ambrosiozyma monospora TaxID=43982 RepID=A0A9W7DG74_AMBMO|nr:unnamed protein product [Ambrosiozyma monospora]